jgi:regulator of protease activity HflC (stomatin/prohibitin superfamily)
MPKMDAIFALLPLNSPRFWLFAVAIFLALLVLWRSLWTIGPTEVGLVRKHFGLKSLSDGSPVAFGHQAGYQADLLMPGLRFKFWPVFVVTRHPMVQIPAGQIGVVIAQVGTPLPIGAKSAVYKPEFGNFNDLRTFVHNGGQKGVQRPVLSPGTVIAIHPVGFLVITKDRVYGVPVAEEYAHLARSGREFGPASFGLEPEQLNVLRIQPKKFDDVDGKAKIVDQIGIVTTLDGTPLPKGAIANRLGDFEDIARLERLPETKDSDLVEAMLAVKNDVHNNYQDFQTFLDQGGRIGLQHDPLLYGAYNLNPFLVAVEIVPMLVVNQGEVAVVKGYVGLATEDTSGADFKFGALVRPGHRGIWQEPLRTGKYAINPRCYSVEIVPTFILTLNWAEATSTAHNLDKDLKQIVAKSREGFVFSIDLQVQIHVPDTEAPKVISIVGSMKNLVNEVLQAAVGNHFRDKLQSMPAIDFIEKRQDIQAQAQDHIANKLKEYRVETRGVYIQDVVFPPQLVGVLTAREIANQQQKTFESEKQAQDKRLDLEASRGRADMQSELAKSTVGIDIAKNRAQAVQAAADGEAYQLTNVGRAKAVETEAQGLAVAKGFEAQQQAIGKDQTTLINVTKALASGEQRFMPVNLALTVGADGGANFGGLTPLLMQYLQRGARRGEGPDAHPDGSVSKPRPNGKAEEGIGADTSIAGPKADKVIVEPVVQTVSKETRLEEVTVKVSNPPPVFQQPWSMRTDQR